ncbi:S-layer homology domain-containing protein [Paenibacillus gansuensis]|uniref:S-layer homology domain-containing protein n=1 Tax=Paenibacillus gansuensis TaxID=306542 RepID=A0ABW5PIP9_9BACL
MRKKKWMIGLAISAILVTGCSTSSAASMTSLTKFNDVKDTHWASASITKVANEGIINGLPGNKFNPEANVSRAEFLKMVVLTAGLSIPEKTSQGAWYEAYVKVATEQGIYKNTDFSNWKEPSTRLEMARMAVRALDPSLKGAGDKQLMYEATKRGFITGVANGELGKSEKSTRAQAAVVIDRMLQLKEGTKLPVDKRAASYAEVEYRGSNLETMWGARMNTLPQSADFSPAVKGTFNQVLIIDMDDPSSPYKNLVPGLLDGNDNGKNSYVLAWNVTMENTAIVPKGYIYFHYVLSHPYVAPAIIPPDMEKLSPFDDGNKPLLLNKKNKITIWHLETISKNKIAEFKEKNWPFWYFDWSSSQKRIELAPKGRIFGE